MSVGLKTNIVCLEVTNSVTNSTRLPSCVTYSIPIIIVVNTTERGQTFRKCVYAILVCCNISFVGSFLHDGDDGCS